MQIVKGDLDEVVLRGLNKLTLFSGEQLFAIFDPEGKEQISKFILHTDRRLTVSTSQLELAVDVFRKYRKTQADKTAETFFMLKCFFALRQDVTIIIYSDDRLTYALRRLGAAICKLNGNMKSFDHAIASDTEVFDLATRAVGCAWNARGLSLKIGGIVHGGRLGNAVREFPGWKGRLIVGCGDVGETGVRLPDITKYIGIDAIPNPTAWRRDLYSWESDIDRSPEHVTYRAWGVLPVTVASELRADLKSMDVASLHPFCQGYRHSLSKQKEVMSSFSAEHTKAYEMWKKQAFEPVYGKGPSFAVLPAGSGKSYNWQYYDIDLLIFRYDTVLKPLRDQARWDQTNSFIRIKIEEELADREIIMVHSSEMVPLKWVSNIIFSGRLSDELVAKVAAERGGQWGKLTALNQSTSVSEKYPSHAALQLALNEAVSVKRTSLLGDRTRAGLKLYDLLPFIEKKGKFLALADAPGDFSIILLDSGYSGGGISLASGDAWFPKLSLMYGSRWRRYGSSGDLTDPKEIGDLPSRSFDLITADGWAENFPALFAGEVSAISKCSTLGGSALIKLYQIDNLVMHQLVRWVTSMFDSFRIIKPRHSRAINDERYLILNHFHGSVPKPVSSIDGPWIVSSSPRLMDSTDAVIADSNMKLGRLQVDALRLMFDLVHRDVPIEVGQVRNTLLPKMNQLENRRVFLLPGKLGINWGYRALVIQNTAYVLCDFGFPMYFLTPYVFSSLSNIPLEMELMRGRRIVGNFLSMPWIKGAYLHRVALFSLSNDYNAADSWKEFMSGGGDFTFNYPNPSAVATFNERDHSRATVSIEKGIMVSKFEKTEYFDRMVAPAKVMSWALSHGIQTYSYTFNDFSAVMCSDGYEISKGEFGPFNPNDRFMNLFCYFTTKSPGTVFPDYRNTQTWWVKTPTALMRSYLHMGPDDARKYRALGMRALPVPTRVFLTKGGYYYGFIPSIDRSVDCSGHAISMLIMAGFGMVDIGRYWDTVIAVTRVALRGKGFSKEYDQMVIDKVLTEDALHDPYKIWHSIWDYRSALNAYIIGAKDMRYPISVWVIRITQTKLDEMDNELPELRTLKRSKVDALVRAAYRRA